MPNLILFLNFTVADYGFWTSVIPAGGVAPDDVVSCQHEDCDGLFVWDDGSTPYNYAASNLSLYNTQARGCLVLRYASEVSLYVLDDHRCDRKRIVVCRN